MNSGFWSKLKKPIMVLAPMADVTDVAFRSIIAKYGKPDVMWTEFVSADGLALAPEEGRKKLMRDLEYTEAERPIVAQFFTSKPENMQKAAELAKELGFDGVDINMGCPDRSIEKQKAGAALIKTPALARELIRAAKAGAGDLPVSVKTRIGFNKVEIETWLPELLNEQPAVLTLHARTRKELSLVPARWEFVKRAVELRDQYSPETLIFGNGDAVDVADGLKKIQETGADGIMFGRAIFGNPWLFAKDGYRPTLREKLSVMIEHTKLFLEKLGDIKNFAIMKKHYKAYVNGFPGAAELRHKLMESQTIGEIEQHVAEFLQTTTLEVDVMRI